MQENFSEKEVEKEFKKNDPYAGAVLEEVRDQLKIIIEVVDTIDHKVDRVDAKLEDFRTEVNEKFDAYSDDMKSLRSRKADKRELTLVEHRVTQLERNA